MIKNFFTGTWLTVIALAIAYFIYSRVSYPLMVWSEKDSEGTSLTQLDLIMLSGWVTICLACLFALLMFCIYKIGEAFNNR